MKDESLPGTAASGNVTDERHAERLGEGFHRLGEACSAASAAGERFIRTIRQGMARQLLSWHKRYRRHYWMGRRTGMSEYEAMRTADRYMRGE